MKKHSRIGSLLAVFVFCTAFLLPAPAHPWGWATHIYLMENLGPANEASFYGTLLPDFPQVIPQTEYLFFLQNQTHYKFDRLVDKASSFGLQDLGAGFAWHNEAFGADHSAHVAGFTNPPGTGGYVVFKSGLMLTEPLPFPGGTQTITGFLESLLKDNGVPPQGASLVAAEIAPVVAHSVIEDGIDILLVEEGVAPAAGCLMLSSAIARDAEATQGLLIKSYARNFAARFKIPFAVAMGIISQAEEGFRDLITYYGATLCPQVEPFRPIEGVAALNAFRLNEFIKSVTGLTDLSHPVMPEDAVPVLLAVKRLVQADYLTELSETLASLQAQRP